MSDKIETALNAEEQLNTELPQDEGAESAEAQEPEQGAPKKGGNVDKLLWVVLSILGVLLIISAVVLSLRLVDFAKIDDRELSLSTNMDETLNIFAMEYKNDSGEVTIQGAEGDKVLAPGADIEYTIRIRNTDKTALDFRFSPDVHFLSDIELPLEVRLLGPDEKYIIGSAAEWVPMSEINEFEHAHTLRSGECVEYYFQWRWPFESGNDQNDTWLGNNTLNTEVGAQLAFSIHAVANTDAELNDGIFGHHTPDVFYIIVFIVLLIAAIVVLIITVVRYFRKKLAPAPEEPVAEPEPIPEPEEEEMDAETLARAMMASKNIIRIDVLDANFEDGAFINLDVLKRKGLMHPEATTLKILSKGHYVLGKAFTVETHRISDEARRVILRAGGDVRIMKD